MQTAGTKVPPHLGGIPVTLTWFRVRCLSRTFGLKVCCLVLVRHCYVISSGDNVAVSEDFVWVILLSFDSVSQKSLVRITCSVLCRVAQKSLGMSNVDCNLNFALSCVLNLLLRV